MTMPLAELGHDDGPSTASERRHAGRAGDSAFRALLRDRRVPAWRKYTGLVIGRPGLMRLLWFELVTLGVGDLPGALGLLLRGWLYPTLLGACGAKPVFGRGITLRHPHRIVLGDRVVLDDRCALDAKGGHKVAIQLGDDVVIGRNTSLICKTTGGTAGIDLSDPGGRIRVGAAANLSLNCTFISESLLSIGEKVLVAGHCYVIAGGNHGWALAGVPIIDQPMDDRGGVSIGDGAWLGASATVLDGVDIGAGAVVAAGALVRTDVPANALAGGVPAKVLREREAAARISPRAVAGPDL